MKVRITTPFEEIDHPAIGKTLWPTVAMAFRVESWSGAHESRVIECDLDGQTSAAVVADGRFPLEMIYD